MRSRLATVAASVFVVVAAGAAAGERVLARWQGGELTESDFVQRFDADGEAIRRGGEFLEKQVCKAVFQTVYGERGRLEGIETSAGYLEAVAQWRDHTLASAYVRQHLPRGAELVGDADLRRFYEDNRGRLYTSTGTADIDVLFVRCGVEDLNVESCADRMDAYRERVEVDGDAFAKILAEERALSGSANGSFSDVPLTNLAPELREAVLTTPAGFTSQVVETPIGLFWIKVLRRIDPAAIDFDAAKPHIRAILEEKAAETWRAEAAARVRVELGLDPALSDEASLAAAAVAEGLDQDAVFLAAERAFTSWKIADLAFLADDEVLPDDAEIAARIAASKTDPDFRRFDVDLVVVTVGADRYAAMKTAEIVRRKLDSRDALTELDGVELIPLSGVTAGGLERVSRQLAEAVVNTVDGAVVGPLAYPKGLVLPGSVTGFDEERAVAASLIIAVRRSSRSATVDEVRLEVQTSFRNEITAVDRFTEVFRTRWGFVLMPDDAENAESPGTEAAASMEGN